MKTRLFIVFAAVLLALLLTACAVGGNDAVQRRRAERFGAVSTPAQVATVEPTIADVERASGDTQDDTLTQLFSVALVVIFGIPAFWIIMLRKGGRK